MRRASTSMLAALTLAAGGNAFAVDRGAEVYATRCAACHHASGQGTPGIAPAVAGVLAPLFDSAEGRRYVIQVLVSGLSGRIVSQGQVFFGAMAAQTALSDGELADAANHVARQLNASTGPSFNAEEFAQARRAPVSHKDLRDLRARLLP